MCSLGDDPGSLRGRVVGVLDVERDTADEDREDGLFVKDSKSCIRELSHLVVGDLRDRERILNEVRVDRENVINIGPVLIYLCAYCGSEDGTGDIRSASGECDYVAALGIAEETGEDCNGVFFVSYVSEIIVSLRKDDCFACCIVLKVETALGRITVLCLVTRCVQIVSDKSCA